MITVFKSITDVSAGFHRSLDWSLDRIRNGASKEAVSLIRIEEDKERRNELKKRLPSLCFSGKFKSRSIAGLVEHSGLICLDFDGYNSDVEMLANRETICANDYTLAAFISPSGKGLKVLVKIPADAETHKAAFDALAEVYKSDHFDHATSDVSRVCFESYDPELYYNSEALTFLDFHVEEDLGMSEDKTPTVVLKSENRIIESLVKWWTRKYGNSKGSRNTNLFKLAVAMNDYGVQKLEATAHLLKYQEADFKAGEIERVVESAYKNTAAHGIKQMSDSLAESQIKQMVRSGKAIDRIAKAMPQLSESELEYAVEVSNEEILVENYWNFTENGKIVVSPTKFRTHLIQAGYCKYFPTGNDGFIFAKIESNILREVSPAMIKDEILLELLDRDEIGSQPFDHIARNTGLFKAEFLNMLPTADIKMKRDTPCMCYLYYRNCAVEISKDGVKAIDYVDLDSYVWKDQIIDRDFNGLQEDGGQYEEFVNLIAEKDDEKIASFRSVIGYLLNSYKNSGNNRAVILNDAVISDVPQGGSGKGVFCTAITHIKRTSTLDGKAFSFDSSFPYQTVAPDSQVLVFDDIARNFKFERMFSLITEGINLERKNQQAIKIPVKDSPRIVLSTNYVVGGTGNSFARRKFEMELGTYFGENMTPLDHFGCMLFDDWDETEWARFDSFMIKCEMGYLETGLVQCSSNNLEMRKFVQSTSPAFAEWVGDPESISLNTQMNKAELFQSFQKEYYSDHKNTSQRKFVLWIKEWAQMKGYEVSEGKSYFRWIMVEKPEANTDF